MNRTVLSHITSIAASLLLLIYISSCSGSKSAIASTSAHPEMNRELAAAGKNVVELNSSKSENIASAIAKSYTPWEQVSLKGKIKLDGIPVSLGVKIYMQRGESLIMSLSAPLLGEVGRIEMSGDSILMVNKRSKTYCREATASRMAQFGASLTDVQDLLLGHVFMLGYGTLSPENASQIEVSEGASDTWILTPKVQHPQAQYGFTLYSDGLMMMAAAFTPDEKYLATADYSYDKSGTDITLSLKADKKALKLTMDLEQPNYSPTPLEPVSINPKWSKQSFRQWIKSLA